MGERLGAEEVLLKAAVNESHLLEGAGQHELAAEAAGRALASADAQHLGRISVSTLAINQAEPLFALGRWDEALKVASRASNLYLGLGTMHRAMLHTIAGSIKLGRGDLDAATRIAAASRDLLRTARYEDQHQLPLGRLEILLALATNGPAAAIAAAGQAMDQFGLYGGSPRYTWPVVAAAADAVLAAARQAATAHDAGLRDQAAGLGDRLRTVTEKLAAFGPAQHAWKLTVAAADAHAARLLAAFPGAGTSGRDAAGRDGAAAAADRLARLARRATSRHRRPPGTRQVMRGTRSANRTQRPGRCCTPRRSRWPAATARLRPAGCSVPRRWPPNWARRRSASRSPC